MDTNFRGVAQFLPVSIPKFSRRSRAVLVPFPPSSPLISLSTLFVAFLLHRSSLSPRLCWLHSAPDSHHHTSHHLAKSTTSYTCTERSTDFQITVNNTQLNTVRQSSINPDDALSMEEADDANLHRNRGITIPQRRCRKQPSTLPTSYPLRPRRLTFSAAVEYNNAFPHLIMPETVVETVLDFLPIPQALAMVAR